MHGVHKCNQSVNFHMAINKLPILSRLMMASREAKQKQRPLSELWYKKTARMCIHTHTTRALLELLRACMHTVN